MNKLCEYPGCMAILTSGRGRPAKFCAEHKWLLLAEKQRRYREAHAEEIAEKQRRYYEAHAEEIAEKQRRYYEAHAEEIAKRKRRYREARKARRAEILAEFTRYLQSRQPTKPEARPEYLISAPVKSNRCQHCGRPFIRRYEGEEFCRKPACQAAEKKKFGRLSIAISKIAAGVSHD